MTILSIDIYTSALNFEAVIFMIASSSSAYFHTSEHLHFAAVFLYPCPDHHSMHIPSLLKSEYPSFYLPLQVLLSHAAYILLKAPRHIKLSHICLVHALRI